MCSGHCYQRAGPDRVRAGALKSVLTGGRTWSNPGRLIAPCRRRDQSQPARVIPDIGPKSRQVRIGEAGNGVSSANNRHKRLQYDRSSESSGSEGSWAFSNRINRLAAEYLGCQGQERSTMGSRLSSPNGWQGRRRWQRPVDRRQAAPGQPAVGRGKMPAAEEAAVRRQR